MSQVLQCADGDKQWAELETCHWSFFRLCARPPGSELSFWRDRVVPYLIAVGAFLAVPILVGAMTLPTLTKRTGEGAIPCLLDFNVLFMFGVTLPLLIVLLVTERSLIPARIASVMAADVLVAKDNTLSTLAKDWEQRYAIANAVAQLIGVAVAVVVFYMNYLALVGDSRPHWQVTDGRMNPAGWIYLLWQLPGFYFVACVYVVRGATTVALLSSIARDPSVKVNLLPFHPDGAGGLQPIGRIGLRNQYVLAACGINILLTFCVVGGLGTASRAQAELLIAASAFYIVAGPAVFIGPLLPFRKSMLASKRKEQQLVADRLRKEYEAIKGHLPQEGVTKADVDSLKRLQKLQRIVDQIPVWPFDAITLRRFLVAYVLPLLPVIIAPLVEKLIQ